MRGSLEAQVLGLRAPSVGITAREAGLCGCGLDGRCRTKERVGLSLISRWNTVMK